MPTLTGDGDPDDWRASVVPPGTPPAGHLGHVAVQETLPLEVAEETPPTPPTPDPVPLAVVPTPVPTDIPLPGPPPPSPLVQEALKLLEARPPLARCATPAVAEQLASWHLAAAKPFPVIAAGLDYAAQLALAHDVAQEPMTVPRLVALVLQSVRTQRTEKPETRPGRTGGGSRSRFSVPQQPYDDEDEWMTTLRELGK